MTGAGGGALLAISDAHLEALDDARRDLAAPRSGVRVLAMAKAQWMLGRPSLYALPSAIPGLHLGETIYHPAHEARAISGVSASLVRDALVRADADLGVRTAHARLLEHLRAAAVVPLSSELPKVKDKAQAEIKELKKKLPPEIGADIDINKLTLDAIHVRQKSVFGIIQAKGKMSAQLQK